MNFSLSSPIHKSSILLPIIAHTLTPHEFLNIRRGLINSFSYFQRFLFFNFSFPFKELAQSLFFRTR